MLFKSIFTASLAVLASVLSVEARKPKNHKVVVGGEAGLVYTPNHVKAHVGDTVTFHFHFKNHTVTQSSFEKPCEPLEGGFDSGFMPVAMDATEFPTFTIPVKDKNPIWIHCEQVNHCASGMVFAVNAPKKGNTFKKFLEMAKENDELEHECDCEYDEYECECECDEDEDECPEYEDDDSYSDGGSYKRSVADSEEDVEEKRDILSRITGKRDTVDA
ncbi:hypothetical protein FRB90_001441 [Tulasnella sp. 427]|nr:hypothetical protein FRB90_001441 [Tulasnella sp. 427]